MKYLLLVATKPEWSLLKKDFQVDPIPLASRLPLYSLKEKSSQIEKAVLCQIGIGPERARQSLNRLFMDFQSDLDAVIHFGLSGALVDHLQVADLLLVKEIKYQLSSLEIRSSKFYSKIKNTLEESQADYKEVALLTSSKVLHSSEEKRGAGQESKAEIVDMESYPIAQICAQRSLSYVSLRSVFDELKTDLPTQSSDFLNREGDLDSLTIAKNIIKKPSLMMRLPEFQRASSRACEVLRRALIQILNL